jgi:hypothetical protein
MGTPRLQRCLVQNEGAERCGLNLGKLPVAVRIALLLPLPSGLRPMAGRTLVATDGSCDLFHPRHMAPADKGGGMLCEMARDLFSVPSQTTLGIQEVRVFLVHAICALAEEHFFPSLSGSNTANSRT